MIFATTELDTLHDHIPCLVDILETSHKKVIRNFNDDLVTASGYAPLNPLDTAHLAEEAVTRGVRGPAFDLCCGTGDFALMMALYCVPSVGIDVNPHLIEEAQHNLEIMQSHVPYTLSCRFSTGNIYHGRYLDRYQSMSTNRHGFFPPSLEDPYRQLDVKLCDADVVFAHTWAAHHSLLTEMLYHETRPETLYILRHSASFDNGTVEKLPIKTFTMGAWRKIT